VKEDKTPLKEPIAVLLADTITTFFIRSFNEIDIIFNQK
jgi:hypothetical protein